MTKSKNINIDEIVKITSEKQTKLIEIEEKVKSIKAELKPYLTQIKDFMVENNIEKFTQGAIDFNLVKSKRNKWDQKGIETLLRSNKNSIYTSVSINVNYDSIITDANLGDADAVKLMNDYCKVIDVNTLKVTKN